jgi:hypothetical protein
LKGYVEAFPHADDATEVKRWIDRLETQGAQARQN